jgi:hypothetical protein
MNGIKKRIERLKLMGSMTTWTLAGFTARWIGNYLTTYRDKSAPSLKPLAFNLEKCDELRAIDTLFLGSTTYNRHTGVPRLPEPGPGVHRTSSLTTLVFTSELEVHIAGVAVCNSQAAQAAWL